MDFLQIILVALCISHATTKSRSKKRHGSSSEETIENLLYFKDCQKEPKEEPTTPQPVPLRLSAPLPPPSPPPQPQCPFPKMCCALSCGNECGGAKEQAFISRQMEPIQRQGYPPIQPPIPGIRKRKKMKFPPVNMLNSRRGFGFTKEKIKSLINQDNDIRKILKDLVRVTMQKVDLMELQKVENSNIGGNGALETEVNEPPLELTVQQPYENDYVEK